MPIWPCNPIIGESGRAAPGQESVLCASVSEQERSVHREICLPVWPAMPQAGRIECMLDLPLSKKLIHSLHGGIERILRATAEPKNLKLVVEHRGISLFPLGAVARAAECADIGELIEVMQTDGP